MIRPFTLITAILAMLSGAYLFAVKHRAQVLDDQLSAVSDQTRLDEQRIRVLQAQWSLEIDPTRLSQLARQFTSLQPMRPAQLTTLASLEAVLPPAGRFPPATNPAAPMPDMPASGTPDMSPVAGATPAAATLRLASAELPAAPVQTHPAMPVQLQHAASRPARHQSGHSHITEAQLAENLAAPRPVRSVYPVGAQVMSVRATDNTEASDGGSVLALGSDMAPPQPLQDGTNH